MITPFCASPFVRAYTLPDGSFRECCATSPWIRNSTDTFPVWWAHDQHLLDFRQQMQEQQFPASCRACEVQEHTGDSLRTAMNRAAATVQTHELPQQWSIMFGNVCNLSCWSCSEMFSSTIAAHKKKLNILPADFVDSNVEFERRWPALKQSILQSYNLHKEIVLVLLGGEPSYNPLVYNFLLELVEKGLANRTKLEITTNGTKTNNKFIHLIETGNWLHISAFVSVDAIGKKAEWLRHGSQWNDVESVIAKYQAIADRVELHTVVSVLNLHDLPALYDYAKQNNLIWTHFLLQEPNFLNIKFWDGEQHFGANELDSRGLGHYNTMVGSSAMPGNQTRVKQYIDSFGTTRKSLLEHDPFLFDMLKMERFDNETVWP